MDPIVSALLYPASVAALGAWIGHQFKKRDQREDRIQELLVERDAIREAAIKERWANFSTTICAIKEKVEDISTEIHDRVPFHVCDERERKFQASLDKHDERIRKVGG